MVAATPTASDPSEFARGRRKLVLRLRSAPLYTGVLITILDVLLIVHAIRTGRFMPWGYVILFLPGIGALIYVAFELAPEWFGSYAAQNARRSVAAALDPAGRYHAFERRTPGRRHDRQSERSCRGMPEDRQAEGGAGALPGDPCPAARRRTGLPHRQGARSLRSRPRGRRGRDARGARGGARRTFIRPRATFFLRERWRRRGGPARRSRLTPSADATFPGPEPRVREARLLEQLGRRDQARSSPKTSCARSAARPGTCKRTSGNGSPSRGSWPADAGSACAPASRG